MIFPVAFSYFLLSQTKKNRILYFLLLSIIYATLMICQSRGIWISISLIVILAIYIIIKFNLLKIFKENKKWLTLLLITFLVITIIYSIDNPLNKSAITVPQRAMTTFDENDPSINTRFLIWKTTLEMIKDRPLLGSGIGTFKMNYLFYQAEFLKNNFYYLKYSGNAKEAHNEYLQMATELGMVGLGIFLSIFIVFYSLIIKYFKKEESNQKKLIVFGLLMGITCFLIPSFFLAIQYMGQFNSSIKSFKLKLLENIIHKNSKFKILLSILIILLMIFTID